MNLRFRQCLAAIGVAAILAYMNLISLSDIRGYVAWPADMLTLSLTATLCGILLALVEENATLLLAMASVLSVLFFGGFWGYATWALLGKQTSFVELIFSDLVFLYTVQRGALLIALSLIFGLLGVTGAQLFLPGRGKRGK